jgi:predicted DNA-binding protein
MADKISIQIDLTVEEHARVAALAHEQGYATPADYVRALIETEVDEADAELAEKAALLEDFRQSIREALTGQTIPASEMWAALEADDE